MRYLAIDIETTGLDPENNQILEIAMILEDTEKKLPRKECPRQHLYIDREAYIGNSVALEMNAHTFKKINDLRNDYENDLSAFLMPEESISSSIRAFFQRNDITPETPITPAGANFSGFDLRFLEQVLEDDVLQSIHRRSLDPSNIFIDFSKNHHVPSLATCKIIAGVEGKVLHNAMDDAWDVIEILRKRY